eukprot:3384614-Rhodomonas_salina.1
MPWRGEIKANRPSFWYRLYGEHGSLALIGHTWMRCGFASTTSLSSSSWYPSQTPSLVTSRDVSVRHVIEWSTGRCV